MQPHFSRLTDTFDPATDTMTAISGENRMLGADYLRDLPGGSQGSPNYGQTLHRTHYNHQSHRNPDNTKNYPKRIGHITANYRSYESKTTHHEHDTPLSDSNISQSVQSIDRQSGSYIDSMKDHQADRPATSHHSGDTGDHQKKSEDIPLNDDPESPESIAKALSEEHFRRAHEANVRYMQVLREQEDQYQADLADYQRRLAEYTSQLEKWKKMSAIQRKCKPKDGNGKVKRESNDC
ncbi:hypothetical protein WR25_08292 [Diploscapter pachys]|uniref:Uncharacterized protein n=1 Tax=Diploscapter pachys TaxID=2018661 RepID=A0A2A2KY36_9BILA|nr:hypothetical protein WR25_08292 [Diploscapter pachys]